MTKTICLILAAVLLAACTPNPPAKEERMSTDKWEKMDIVLTTETYPPLPEEADTLYRYALWHDINTRRKPSTRHKLLPYLRYYRIAAANGHWQANKTLQHILMYNEDVDIPDRRDEGVALNELLAQQLPATADLWWSTYILFGYGPKHDKGDAAAYLRRAADRGNPEAMYMIAELLSDQAVRLPEGEERRRLLDLSDKFYRYSADKIHRFPSGKGGEQASITATVIQHNAEDAMFYAQQSLRGGTYQGAVILQSIFEGEEKELSVKPDQERAHRYEVISDYLFTTFEVYPEAMVEEIDDIVPLPPAPLPEWDGKLNIQRFVEGEEPPKPTEELVEKLAAAKGLDPATGLPLPKKETARRWWNWWD